MGDPGCNGLWRESFPVGYSKTRRACRSNALDLVKFPPRDQDYLKVLKTRSSCSCLQMVVCKCFGGLQACNNGRVPSMTTALMTLRIRGHRKSHPPRLTLQMTLQRSLSRRLGSELE